MAPYGPPSFNWDGGINSLYQKEAVQAFYLLLSVDSGPVGAGVTITGAQTSQATAYQLKASNTWITNVAAGGAVTLPETSTPNSLVGMVVKVNNSSANPLTVFPNIGDIGGTVNGAASITVPPGETMEFHCFIVGTWIVDEPAGVTGPLYASTIIGGTTSSSTLTLESTSGVGTTDFISFKTGSQAEAGRINSFGNAISWRSFWGFNDPAFPISSSPIDNFFINLTTGPCAFIGATNNSATYAATFIGYGNHTSATTLVFAKTRAAASTAGSVIVQSGDALMDISAWASLGNGTYSDAADIICRVEGTVSATATPTRFEFYTTPAGSITTAERMRIDSAGRMTLGGAANQLIKAQSLFQVNDTTNSEWQLGTAVWNSSGSVGGWVSAVSRGTSIGSHVASQANDYPFYLEGDGDTGSAFQTAAYTGIQIDGTVSGSSMPGRWVWGTTPAGATLPVERMRMDSAGNINIGNQGPTLPDVYGANPSLEINRLGGAVLNLGLWANAPGAQYVSFTRSRGAAIGTKATVQFNDGLGLFVFAGYDATGGTPVLQEAAGIYANVDGSPNAGSVPGRLGFSTTPLGGVDTERLSIDSQGHILLGGGPSRTGLNGTQAPVQLNTLSSTIFGIQRWSADNNPAAVWMAKSRSGTIGTHAAVIANDDLGNVAAGGSDGTNFQFAISQDFFYDTFGQINSVASGSFTTASTSIALTGPGGGYIVPGAVVWDTTANAKVGTVLTQNGSTIVLTAASLINSSGGSDTLQFITPNTIPGRQTFSTAQVQVIDINATGSFTTASTTITLSQALPSWAIAGSYVYDRTTNSAIGKVASGAGTTTITLQANSLINSSGSNDNIQIQAPAAVMTEVLRLDASGMVTIQPSSFWWSFAQLYIPSNTNSPWNIQVDQLAGAITDPCYVLFRKSRGLYGGANVAVQSGDGVLQMLGRAVDTGLAFRGVAQIGFNVDAAPTNGSVPGNITFGTAASGGGGAVTERMRINSRGWVGINTTSQFYNAPNSTFSALDIAISPVANVYNNGTNGSGSIFLVGVYATGTSPGTNFFTQLTNYNNDGYGDGYIMTYGRGSLGSEALAASTDNIGQISFRLYVSGTGSAAQFKNAAGISADADGTVSATASPGKLRFYTTPVGSTSQTERLRINNAGSVMMTMAALATTAVDGFFYMNSCAGAPTGAPTAAPGAAVPFVFDTTNSKIWVRTGGAWKGVVVA